MKVDCILYALLCLFLFLPTNGNIHRSVSGSANNHRTVKVKDHYEDHLIDEGEEVEEGFFDRLYSKSKLDWLYSIPAALVVGSTGIFPLLIFPAEAGKSMRDGISASKLRILLSFAAGGLLGDVFLHLLPESWMYIGGNQYGHLQIGLWILIGLLSFLVLEKGFSEEEASEEPGITKEPVEQDERREKHSNGFIHNDEAAPKPKPDDEKRFQDNNEVKNEVSDAVAGSTGDKIKVIGYLNLLANCIDNFTHGLAVAGSFIVSWQIGICTTFAILLHEIPHEIGDFAILLKAGFSRWDAAKGQLITASGAVVGAMFGLLSEGASDSSSWILPFTAGGFMYIAMVTIIPDLLQETRAWESLKQLVAMVIGIACMGMVSVIHH